MLLSGPHISAYACPSFDIASQHVQCSHGAALGAIDENQLWYVQARGINYRSAANLIIQARCLACLDKEIPQNIYELIGTLLVQNIL